MLHFECKKQRGEEIGSHRAAFPAWLLLLLDFHPCPKCRAARHGAPGLVGLQHLLSERRLQELHLSGLEQRRRWGGLTAAFQRLEGLYKQKGDVLLAQCDSDRTKGGSLELKRGHEVTH